MGIAIDNRICARLSCQHSFVSLRMISSSRIAA